MKAILIDDEKPSRVILQQLLVWHCPQVKLMAKCSSVDEGLTAIITHQPDIVFLDIAMPNKNGFDLFTELDEINFDVVFTTAYDEFALEAFKVHATAYLLKPIDKDLLISTISTIEKRKSKNVNGSEMHALMKLLQQEKPRTGKIGIPTLEGVDYIAVDSIIRCLAEGNYTRIYLSEGTEMYVSKSLKMIEEMIDNPLFIRPHNSHLVNAQRIKKYVKGAGGYIVLDDGSTIPVSRTKKDALDFL